MSDFRPPKDRTLGDWLAHIQTQHWRSIDLTLERVAQVWARLRGRPATPHDPDPNLGLVIAVAGTNGKGSCVAMLEAVLRDAGLKTGSYTSPHLVRYNERVRVDGRAAHDAALCEAFAEIEGVRDGIPLTYFEFGTLCALLIFRRARVDASILEVGMGGRLDAVNLVDNDLALITSIGIDHAQWLGADRETIGLEKAGIIKKHALAVCADPAPPPGIARVAAAQNCALLQSGVDYRIEQTGQTGTGTGTGGGIHWRSDHSAVADQWRRVDGLQPPLGGGQQLNNLGGVVAVLALTQARTGVTPKNLIAGLANTQLPARCQVLGGAPEIVLDVAHNLDSARDLAAFLARRKNAKTHGETHGVFGILADKPVAEIIALMDGVVDRWYLATLAGERGQTAESLKEQLALAGSASPATLHASPLAAGLAALGVADARDRVVIFGSFYTVGDIIAHFEHDGRADARRAT